MANYNALLHIFNAIRDKNLFGKEVTDLEFAVGLKLFTKVIIRQKNHPLFEALRPQILELIEDLRSSSMEYKIIEL